MIDLKNEQGQFLQDLCDVNGRSLRIRNDGFLETADIYDGCDRQQFQPVISGQENTLNPYACRVINTRLWKTMTEFAHEFQN